MPIDITDQPRRAQYAISGVGPYDVDFEILAETDIAVYRDATLLALTTDYTVVVNADGTSAVTLVSATGTTLTIVGARPYRRITDYATGGDFRATTMNDELDSLQIQILQIDERVDRSIKIAAYDTSEVSAELPISRANGYLAFDADGNAIISSGTGADAGLRDDLASGDTGLGAGLVAHLSPDTGASSVSVFSILRSRVRPQFFGAVGDGVNDDAAAILLAMQRAANRRCLCEIPGTNVGYLLNATGIVATDLDYLMVEGEGILIPVGGNALTLDSTTHARISGIGIHGTSTAVHGIELINSSHYNKFTNMWLGYMAGDAIKVFSGQSNMFELIIVDQNNGFHPFSPLPGGLTNGAVTRSFHVESHAGGNTNNQTFVNCQSNAAGTTYAVQIGTNAGMKVETTNWFGGLIQGVESLLFIHGKNCSVRGTHIEPPAGVIPTYVVTLDECSGTRVVDCEVAGDARIINNSVLSGFDGCIGCGVDIAAGSEECYAVNGEYGNIVTGPGGGAIKDKALNSRVEGMRNASNARVFSGRNMRNPAPYFHTIMEDWVGGGSPTVPCGFDSFGTPTITRETNAAHIRSGSYSVKVVHSSDADEGFQIDIKPDNAAAFRRIHVTAWVKNVTTAGLAQIQLVEGGTGASVSQASYRADAFERMSVTFVPNSLATSAKIRFTGLTGTVYWDAIDIEVEDHTPLHTFALADSATPSATDAGYHIPNLVTTGTTAITNLLNPHVGKPVTIRLGAATDFTDGAGFQLAGGANWTTGVAGDTLTMVYGSDGVWREVGRSVN